MTKPGSAECLEGEGIAGSLGGKLPRDGVLVQVVKQVGDAVGRLAALHTRLAVHQIMGQVGQVVEGGDRSKVCGRIVSTAIGGDETYDFGSIL